MPHTIQFGSYRLNILDGVFADKGVQMPLTGMFPNDFQIDKYMANAMFDGKYCDVRLVGNKK